MPQTPLQMDPERPRPEETEPPVGSKASGSSGSSTQSTGEPGSFIAQDGFPEGPVQRDPGDRAAVGPVRIRTNRYGELEEHELIKLLDTIDDERARSRFRESIYISLFIWLAIAWVVFYGPRYLWHAPRLISPVDALKQQALVELNDPKLTAPPVARPAPKLDNRTLERLRSMEPKPVPRAPTPAAPATPQPTPPETKPLPASPSPSTPQPPVPTPKPVPEAPRPSANVPEAPTPQPSAKPNFGNQGSASDALQQAMRNSAQGGGSSSGVGIHGSGGGAALGSGVDILSDTQGVNFEPYLQRIMREIYEQWLPLIPEEARPPLSKSGYTQLRIIIMPDGNIHVQDGVHNGMVLESSSNDQALDRAAWGSITGVGQFPPLPKQFHGPNLELRIRYLYNDRAKE